ncbi:MAG: ankyrin repeat domain-containing protein [Epsilonproteobacteria bacterium]|nr:ankyrin repeat domain-containing protein [Campylobacterota bacterium]
MNSKVKNILLFFMGVLLLPLNARPPVRSLKGVDALFKPEYQLLSPSYGCLFAESDIAQTLYRFVLPEFDKLLYDVLHTLFFLNNDNINFGVATSGLLADKNPFQLGVIMGLVNSEDASLLKNSCEEQKKIINNILAGLAAQLKVQVPGETEWKSFFQAMNDIFKGQPKQLKKNIFSNDAKNLATESVQKRCIKMLLGRSLVPGDAANWKDNIIEERKKALLDAEKLWSNVTFCQQLLAEKKTSKISTFIGTCKKVNRETALGKDVATILLNVFLWERCFSRKDLLDYISGLHAVTQQFFQEGTDLLPEETQSSYSMGEIEQIKKTFFEETNDLEILTAEQVAVSFLGHCPLPKELSYKNNVRYKENLFPDCGETSLRNFFNCLFFDETTQHFELDKIQALENKGFVFKRELKDFYTQFPTPADGTNAHAHDAWASLVSGLPDVHYQKGNSTTGGYEISAGDTQERVVNMCRVIRNLMTKVPEELSVHDSLESNVITALWREQFSDAEIVIKQEANMVSITLGACVWDFMFSHFEFRVHEVYEADHSWNNWWIENSIKYAANEIYNRFLFVVLASFFAKKIADVGIYLYSLGQADQLDHSFRFFCLCLLNPRNILRDISSPSLDFDIEPENKFDVLRGYVKLINGLFSSKGVLHLLTIVARERLLDDTNITAVGLAFADEGYSFKDVYNMFKPDDMTWQQFMRNDELYGFKVIEFLWAIGRGEGRSQECLEFSQKNIFSNFLNKKNHAGESLLHLAARINNVEIARVLLQLNNELVGQAAGFRVDKRMPLHTAALYNSIDIASLLLEHKAQIDPLDSKNNTPLLIAARNNYTDLVMLLVNNKAGVNQQDAEREWTPLHWAVANDNVKLVNFLLVNNAGVNVTADEGKTPLFFARSAEVAKILVDAGAEVSHKSIRGNTPLCVAIHWGNVELVRLLIERGAKVTRTALNITTTFEISDILKKAAEKEGIEEDYNYDDPADYTGYESPSID